MHNKETLLLEKRRFGLPETVSIQEEEMLKKGVPVQKIIGYIEMANVKIDVSKHILIPRYETEELILLANEIIKKNNYKSVLDLCSGSGFIGFGIKKKFPHLLVTQSDIDSEAIQQININAKINNLKTNVIQSDIFENIYETYDIIVSNPPYLLNEEEENMSKSVLEHEPRIALFAKDNGMFFYKKIFNNYEKFLNKGGTLLFEINPINVDWYEKNNFILHKDINGKYRFAHLKI